MDKEMEPQEKLAIVKNIREINEKTSSKWDVVIKGQTIRLVIDPCRCGVHAKWVATVPASDMLPPELQRLLGGRSSNTIEKIVEDWHWEPKWWGKVLRLKMEPALMRWIKKSHAEWLDVAKAEERANRVRGLVEQ